VTIGICLLSLLCTAIAVTRLVMEWYDQSRVWELMVIPVTP